MAIPWAAVPLQELMCLHKRRTEALAVRQHLGLERETNIIISGVGKDTHLERFWEQRDDEDFLTWLRDIRSTAFIPPNFSMFLNDPRHQHFFNRKRVIVAADALSQMRIVAVPPLQAVATDDWDFWEQVLKDRPHIRHVALEFQTGWARKERAEWALMSFRALQDKIGRPLGAIVLGGGAYIQPIGRSTLGSVTLVNSTPFMRAVKRRKGLFLNGKLHWFPARGQAVSTLLQANVRAQAAALDHLYQDSLRAA